MLDVNYINKINKKLLTVNFSKQTEDSVVCRVLQLFHF